jgi:MoaA/NifB/PqqE/SkfB family radical SAM enzyme
MFFDKYFRNNDYTLLFNTQTGLEILKGNNGKEDPFVLELPSLLDIGIMGTCVHKCKICYQGHINRPNMTLEHFKQIINEVKHHVNQVALGGRGDPNKHENFSDIVEYCRKNNVVPNYTTSGINLTPEEIEISKLCGAVAVSEYGTDFTYRAINLFIGADVKTNIHYVFTRDTFPNIMKILRGDDIWNNKIDTLKLNAIIFLLFKPQGAAINMSYLVPTETQLQCFSETVFKSKTPFKVGMDSCLVNHIVRFYTPNETQRMSIDTCEGARMSAYISPDMRFMPCSFADKKIWSEKITSKHTITDIWNHSPRFNHFRASLKISPNHCPLYL